jgi:acyl-CoA synthetase (AMP-forming)/AMP-acid ligase II
VAAVNIAARLAATAARQPERLALVEHGAGRPRRVGYGELARRVAELSTGLAARGLAPGDRVLLFIPMSCDLYVALLGCLHAGATAVFVDAWAGRERLDAAIEAARPRMLLAIPKAMLLLLVSPAARRIPTRLAVSRRWFPLGRLAGGGTAREAAAIPVDQPALITFTTGSTGRPKTAARSHAFLWAQHLALSAHLGLRDDDVDMPALPVFVLNNLALGIPSVLPDADPRRPAAIDPAAILRQMEAEGVTTTSGSPAFYDALCRWCATQGRRVPVRALFTGGAPVPPALARLLADTVAGAAHVVYGSTEAEPIAGIEARAMLAAMECKSAERGRDESAPDAGARCAADGVCVGAPVSEVAVRLVQPSDDPLVLGPAGWSALEVPPGATGEVVVAGEHVLGSYFQDPEADRRTKIHDGERVWHRTGDAARFDGQGRLWLMGRVRWRVRRAAATWWSLPAEMRALRLHGVRHAAYFGLPDTVLGQRAVLCVEMLADELAAAERERLRSLLAPIPVDDLHVLRRIPRDPRHESKTNMEALLRVIARPGTVATGRRP